MRIICDPQESDGASPEKGGNDPEAMPKKGGSDPSGGAT